MGVSGNVRALLNHGGKSIADLAEYFGKDAQIMRNKLYKGSFSAEDLAKIAAFLGGELTIRLPNGQSVFFTESDFVKDAK